MKLPGNTMRLSVLTNLRDDLFIFIIVILNIKNIRKLEIKYKLKNSICMNKIRFN
jgi:hypothetical protein